MNPDVVKPRPFYDLIQMLEGPAYYYFKKEDETNLIDVIVRVAIGNTVNGIITVELINFSLLNRIIYLHNLQQNI